MKIKDKMKQIMSIDEILLEEFLFINRSEEHTSELQSH